MIHPKTKQKKKLIGLGLGLGSAVKVLPLPEPSDLAFLIVPSFIDRIRGTSVE